MTGERSVMAYSTLGRDSAHCKHRASKALKPKQQIRRAPAVQALPARQPKAARRAGASAAARA